MMVSVALVLPITLAETGLTVQPIVGEEVVQVNTTVTVFDDGPPSVTGMVRDFPDATCRFLPIAKREKSVTVTLSGTELLKEDS